MKLSDILRRISKYFGHWEVGAVIFSSNLLSVIIKNEVQSKDITN